MRDYSLPPLPQGPQPFGGLFGQPGQGGMGGLVASLAPVISELIRSQIGGNLFGFGADRNIGSAYYGRQYLEQLQGARSAGAQADRDQVDLIIRGILASFGTPSVGKFDNGRLQFAPDVERSIGVLGGDAAKVVSVLGAIAPETVDRLLPGGSMSVAAASFVNAGRFIRDPDTGRTLASDPNAVNRILGPLVAGGREANYGLGAGYMGRIFEELTSRGMVGGGATGQVQSDQIRRQIGSYNQAVSAIRDLFDENGRMGATVPELFKALDSITQGGVGRMSAPEISRIVRTFQGFTQTQAVTLERLGEVTNQTGQLLAMRGGNRALAPYLAARGVAAGTAFQDLGFGQRTSVESADRRDFEEITARDLATGATSEAGNLVGSILYNAQYAAAGSPLAAAAAAISKGQASFALPGGGSFDLRNLTQASVLDLFGRSGISGTTAISALGNRRQNMAALANNPGAASAIETVQRSEVEYFLGGGLSRTFGGASGAIVQALFNAAGNADVASDADLVNLVGNQFGLSAEQRAAIGNQLGQLSAVRGGEEAGFTTIRRYSDAARRQAAQAERQATQRGKNLDDLAGLSRGNFLTNLGRYASIIGRGETPDERQLILKGIFGDVTLEEMAKGLGVPATKEAIDKVLNPDRGGNDVTAPPGSVRSGDSNTVTALSNAARSGGQAAMSVQNLMIKVDRMVVQQEGAGGTITGSGAAT